MFYAYMNTCIHANHVKNKNKLPISILGLVDDIIGISEVGFKAQQMNAIINVKNCVTKPQHQYLLQQLQQLPQLLRLQLLNQ